ncbi:hypothetical protein [Solidesulfovibrio sp.]
MTACSDHGVSLRFSGEGTRSRTMLAAASGAEMAGQRMREGKRFPCKHERNTMTTRDDCRRRFLANDPACSPGNTPCALGQMAAGEDAGDRA